DQVGPITARRRTTRDGVGTIRADNRMASPIRGSPCDRGAIDVSAEAAVILRRARNAPHSQRRDQPLHLGLGGKSQATFSLAARNFSLSGLAASPLANFYVNEFVCREIFQAPPCIGCH